MRLVGHLAKRIIMANLFFICGPHCCGKTTVLKRLEEDGDISFRGFEIGGDLFHKRKFLTETASEAFELEVAHLEIQRDIEFINYNGIIGVETWHPGNMAYAAVRNPKIIPCLCEMAVKSPFIDNAFGVWIVIDKDEIRKRTQMYQKRANWACEFYEKVNSHIGDCLKSLSLFHRVEVIDGNQPIEVVVKNVKKYFNSIFTSIDGKIINYSMQLKKKTNIN